MWPGRGFRMILHTENWQFFVAHSFHRPVIQVDVSDFDIRRHACAKRGNQIFINFDCDDMRSSLRELRRQRAGAGADFDNRLGSMYVGEFDNAPKDGSVT